MSNNYITSLKHINSTSLKTNNYTTSEEAPLHECMTPMKQICKMKEKKVRRKIRRRTRRRRRIRREEGEEEEEKIREERRRERRREE